MPTLAHSGDFAAEKAAKAFKPGASVKDNTMRSSRDVTTGKRPESEARVQRWLRFAKGRIQPGLNDLPPALLPATTAELGGHTIAFEKVVGWHLPEAALARLDSSEKAIQLSLSLSLCHLPSKRFFGTQWMGKRCPVVTSSDNEVLDVFSLDYAEVAYFLSRMADPLCVAVVELVASVTVDDSEVTIAQFGCGWTILHIFGSRSVPDIADGHQNCVEQTCELLRGSPRELLVRDAESLQEYIDTNQIDGSTLRFKQFSHRRLTKLSSHLNPDEIVGQFTVIPGLELNHADAFGQTMKGMLPCLGGTEQRMKDGRRLLLPAMPKLLQTFALEVVDVHVLLSGRVKLEKAVKEFSRPALQQPNDSGRPLQITARRLKVGIHNGHRIIGAWTEIELEEDPGDADLLVPTRERVRVEGYSADDMMALVCLIEYDLGNADALTGTARLTQMTGSQLHLRYRPSDVDSPAVAESKYPAKSIEEDELNIELPLLFGALCKAISPATAFAPPPELSALPESVIGFDVDIFDERGEKLTDQTEVQDMLTSDTRAVVDRQERLESKTEQFQKLAQLEHTNDGLDDDSSVVESLVTGDSFSASLQLARPKRVHATARADTSRDRGFAGTEAAEDVHAYRHGVPVPQHERGLLAQSLQAPLRGSGGLPQFAAQAQQQPFTNSAVSMLGGMLDAQPKELSRADRSRLSRHGFMDVVADSALSAATAEGSTYPAFPGKMHDAVDVQLELRDSLSLHDITLQFAAYKPNPVHTTAVAPRSVYMTYQFYNCRPTRTETMSLLPADPGQSCVLVRADAGSRNDPPLAYKYSIDTSSMSPCEGTHFVKYLATKTLYIDIWNAESLQLVGAVAVPLRMLMRQGKPFAKQGFECPVVSPSEQLNQEAILVRDGCCIVGDTIASLQLIMTNHGERGANRWMLQEKLLEGLGEDIFEVGLERGNDTAGAATGQGAHWRVNRLHGTAHDIGGNSSASKRPRHRVRARPLNDSSNELGQALRSDRDHKASRSPSMKMHVKPSDDRRCMTYADLTMIAKRFRGVIKGTVQYQGAFLKLLDVPSRAKAERKFRRFLRSLNKQNKSMTEYLNRLDAPVGQASMTNCVEAFRDAGANKIMKDGEIRMAISRFSGKADGFIDVQALKKHCAPAPTAPVGALSTPHLTPTQNIVKKLKTINYQALIRLTADASQADNSVMAITEFSDAVVAAVEQCPLDKHDLEELYKILSQASKGQVSWSVLETFLRDQEKSGASGDDNIAPGKDVETDGTRSSLSGRGEIKGGQLQDDQSDGEPDDTEDTYEFSLDPSIRAVEKRLRSLGRALAAKGIDVEAACRKFDPENKGTIGRSELLEVLMQLGIDISEPQVSNPDDDEQRRNQLRQISSVVGPAGGGQIQSLASHAPIDEYMEDLAMIRWFRDGQKRRMLKEVLSRNLTTTLQLPVAFGQASFAEVAVSNPYNHEERFVVEIRDPELRLVTDYTEWTYLRKHVPPATGSIGQAPVETDMFDRDGFGRCQVVLMAHEVIHLPFVFLTMTPTIPALDSNGAWPEPLAPSSDRSWQDGDNLRTIEVNIISATHGHTTSTIKFNILPRPFVVDRTIRLFEQENMSLKRRIRVVKPNQAGTDPIHFGARTSGANSSKFMHCVALSSTQLLTEWREIGEQEQELTFRLRCGAFPSLGEFYMLLYNDQFQAVLYETWHVIVQSRQRLDVHSTLGQATSTHVVVKGDRYLRRTRCFTSAANVQPSPSTTFQLVPGTFSRVELSCTPAEAGTQKTHVTMVDVDSKELLGAWILNMVAELPSACRTYDVQAAPSGIVNKRIMYSNPWDQPRRYRLVSSNERLLQPRTKFLELPAQSQDYIRLSFFFSPDVLPTQVFLLINDENNQLEESFCFNLSTSAL